MEKDKYRYHLAFKHVHNGVLRSNMTYYVSASSDAEAKRKVKEIYSDAKAFRIIGKWENTDRNTGTSKERAAPKAARSRATERKAVDKRIPAKERSAAYFAVIDTETNWSNQVMSIGVVIADAATFQAVDYKYYVIPSACKRGGMYSDALYLKTPVGPESLGKRDAMKDLRSCFSAYGVSDIFAYNAKFDKTHLPDLKNMVWHDIMRLAAYRQHNPKIPASAECCSTGRLKRGYGVEPVLRMLSGNSCYCETHNAILDAVDELEIMRLLGLAPCEYIKL